jgi:hypothetical protein
MAAGLSGKVLVRRDDLRWFAILAASNADPLPGFFVLGTAPVNRDGCSPQHRLVL